MPTDKDGNPLPKLRWVEELALALIHVKTWVVPIGPKSISSAQKVTAILGHAIAFDQDPSELYAYVSDDGNFPLPAERLADLVKLVFVGPTDRMQEVLSKSKVVSCRRSVMRQWAEWLVEYNPEWKEKTTSLPACLSIGPLSRVPPPPAAL